MLRLLRWCRLGARRYRVISSCPKMVTSVTERPFRMGLEGIVSKRTDAPYRSGPSKTWLKAKNPASEAVRRKREEEWR
jgi:ATP-dependent DNA ligase